MAKEEVVPKIGDQADISGHESLERMAENRLKIHMDGYTWTIESESPIKVTQTEYGDEEEDDDD